MQTTLRRMSIQESTLSSLWDKQPKGLSPIEKTLRINSFLNYETLVETSIFPTPPHKWFLDLSLYLLHLLPYYYPSIKQENDLKTLYTKTIRAYIYTYETYRSKKIGDDVKRAYIKEYIKVSDLFLNELKAKVESGN